MTSKTPLERVQGSEKLLERLMLVLPGFRGYKLREQRREADKIVRNHIYDSLEAARADLTRGLQALVDNKATELLEPMNRLIATLDRVAEKINHAAYGYSGFFDSVQINEPELEKMLSFDMQLTENVTKLKESIRAYVDQLLDGKLENARTMQDSIGANMRDLESAFDSRKWVIEGVKV